MCLVRDISGSTVNEHVTSLLYKEICNLLSHSDMTIGEIAIHHKRWAKRRHTSEYHHHQHAQQECHHSILGARVRILYHLVYQLAVVLRVYNALCHALLIHLVVYQLLANMILHKRSHQYRYQRGWNTYHHHILQLYACATQQVGTDNGCRSCRYRTARDAQRRRYRSHAQWSLRSNLRVCRYLRDNRQ